MKMLSSVCQSMGCVFLQKMQRLLFPLAFTIPVTVQSVLMIFLNIYLAKIAIQVCKQIEKETRLSGVSAKVTALKKRQCNSRRNMKPIITLLMVTLGNIMVILVFVALSFLARVFVEYQLLQYVIIDNSTYLIHFLSPTAYGLYFRQVREPMMKRLRRLIRMNKFNVVAPQPQRAAWM